MCIYIYIINIGTHTSFILNVINRLTALIYIYTRVRVCVCVCVCVCVYVCMQALFCVVIFALCV